MLKFGSTFWLAVLILLLVLNLLSVYSWYKNNRGKKLYLCPELRHTMLGLGLMLLWGATVTSGNLKIILVLAPCVPFICMCILIRVQSKYRKNNGAGIKRGITGEIEEEVKEAKNALVEKYGTENKNGDQNLVP